MSENQQHNPYNSRNHESVTPMGRDDIYAVAGLLGHVSGQLKDIDTKNVGGESPFIKANKMDPKQALQRMVDQGKSPDEMINHSQPQQTTQHPQPQQMTQHPQPSPVIDSHDGQSKIDDINRRLDKLERALETNTKSNFKFKRGITYSVNSSKIKGEFKDPLDIIDIVLSEMSKQSKTITLKLNDTTKNSK